MPAQGRRRGRGQSSWSHAHLLGQFTVPLPRVSSSIVLPGQDAGPALLTVAVGEGSANSPSLMTLGPVLPASGIGKGKRSSLPFPPHHMIDEGVLDHLRP